MNKHIELVKKWLADPKSVSQEELQDNFEDADDCAAWADHHVSWNTYAAERAAWYAVDGFTKRAAHWVKRYEEKNNAK